MNRPLSLREQPPEAGAQYRTLSLRLQDDGSPATLSEETRSVEVIAATESAVQVYDYERWEIVDEILLMSGCSMPESRQVPLLDTHSRYDTSTVVGSLRDMHVTGATLAGRAHFTSVGSGPDIYTKVAEGHLTDFSVGYRVDAATWIPDGESAVIDSRTFHGPVKVVTSWRVRELSVCPIGADEQAKARASRPPQEKESVMDKQLRAFLERRGLSKDASEKQAWAYLEKMDTRAEPEPKPAERTPAEAAEPVDVAKVKTEASRAERARVGEITAMCRRFDCDDMAENMIDGEKTIDQARKAVMDHLAAQGDNSPGHRSPVEIGLEDRDKFRAAASDAIMVRGAIDVDKPAPGTDELAGRSLTEMARMALVRSGHRDHGRPLDVIGRALTTSDFPIILSGAANTALADGYATADETWRAWCATGSVSNFQTHTAVRASETDDLDQIPEGTEYKYGDREEAREEYQIVTYGKLLAITRQAIINDDLSALTDIPFAHGEAAARKVGDLPYAVLTANSAMGDGTALFHANHGNLTAAASPGVASLAKAIKAMTMQKDIKNKRRLNIKPQFFLAPRSLEGSAEVLFASEYYDAGSKSATRANPYKGKYFVRVYDSRLDDDSETAWYLAGPGRKTVKIFFLDGVQAPYMETRQGWSVDGVEYKVRIDAGAKAMDWRALVRNPGA